MEELKSTEREIILPIEDYLVDMRCKKSSSSSCPRDIGPYDIEEETDGKSWEEEDVHRTFSISDLDHKWVELIKKRLLEKPKKLTLTSSKPSCTIHRVPHHVRKLNEDAYSSSVVSIGPVHYNDRRNDPLLGMEEYKWKHLNDIISQKGDQWLESCFVSIEKKEKEVRRCYSEDFTDIDSNAFVEMMLLDGCFIIVFFRNCGGLDSSGHRRVDLGLIDDPSIEIHWVKEQIERDIYLLENQIPFTIIEILLDQIGLNNCPEVLSSCKMNNLTHLLHHEHSSIVAFIRNKHPTKKHPTKVVNIPPATVLKEKGIKFKATRGRRNNFLDINFENNEIQIPYIRIKEGTKEKLLNLVAFEQCYPHCDKYVTSYIYFMYLLIDTTQDVEILCKKKVIDNCLGCDEKLAALFNGMGNEVLASGAVDYYLHDDCVRINEYIESRWPKMRAILVRDYFKNPCATISIIGGCMLLLLGIAQTFFSAAPKLAYGG